MWQDLCYSLRQWHRRPGLALLAIVTLGMGIGLNTGIFAAFNTLAFRPWAVPEAERVLRVVPGLPDAEAAYLHQHARAFTGVIAFRHVGRVRVEEGRDAEAIYGSSEYFQTLGVGMAMGRGWTAGENDTAAPAAVAVVSCAMWKSHFGADTGIVGRTVRLENVPFTIIGVSACGFTGTDAGRNISFFLPSAARGLTVGPDARAPILDPTQCCATVAGRLAPGVTREAATAELQTLSRQYRTERRLEPQPLALHGTALVSYGDASRDLDKIASVLIVCALVLLLACANVGNLLLARAAERRPEIALRLALGASRTRIVRQLVTEAALLALGGGAAGIAISRLATRLIVATIPTIVSARAPRFILFEPVLDGAVLGYTLALAVVAVLAFGVAPALHATRDGLLGALKDDAGLRLSLRSLLLAGQVAACVVVLVGAGLRLRAIQHARGLDLGFAIDDVTLVSFEPPRPFDAEKWRASIASLQDALAALPEPNRLCVTTAIPLDRHVVMTRFRLPGQRSPDPHEAVGHYVTAPYFDILGLRAVLGRTLSKNDVGEPVVVVNETTARTFWPGRSALGQTVVVGKETLTIVGVVADSRVDGLGAAQPGLYRPFQPTAHRTFAILAREPSYGAPARIAALAAHVAPGARTMITPLGDSMSAALGVARIQSTLAGSVGVVALILATVGMFGVFAYVTRHKTREIGVRIALGARPAHIVTLVLSFAGRPLVAGIGVGTLGALALSRVLVAQLYGMSPLDPTTYAGVTLILAVAGLAATLVPARRAMRVAPTDALRYE